MSLIARPFEKLLVANRGEIAVRVMRTARAMGYRTVAVHSEADADALHVRLADEAVCIGPPAPLQSYLDIDAVLQAAGRTGADALHPGYGFLAENPELPLRCAEAGVVFVGPPAEAMRLMGDKAAAKRRMIEAGVPVIPGYQAGAQDDDTLAREAQRVGYPLLVKAAAGGGGRGMRVVRQPDQLLALLASARSEAHSAFGSGDLLLERLLERARHVELQIFADTRGEVVHLGERECSVQRRHQKIIEESPSPAVDADLRQRMGAAAVAAARAIGYVNAGTVEFMLGPDGEFYFLEMNTRLQVEHPVTEMVTSLDLVEWQLRVAAGEPLPLEQEQIVRRGHAIEVRLYAEDPYAGFLPQTGPVLCWRPAPLARVDSGIAQGQQVGVHYDPMLAKMIASGTTREEARRRLLLAVEDSVLLGLCSNRQFLASLLRDPAFIAGEVTTDTIDARFARDAAASPRSAPQGREDRHPPPRPEPTSRMWALAAVLRGCPVAADLWRSAGRTGWPVTLELEQQRRELHVTHQDGGRFVVEGAGDEAVQVELLRVDRTELCCELDGVRRRADFVQEGELLHLQLEGLDAMLREPAVVRQRGREGEQSGRVCAPIAGKLLALDVEPGETVELGQRVAVLEAMKMEHRVIAPSSGRVVRVLVEQGEQVAARQLLVELEADEGKSDDDS